jgi:hypothetical protein
MVMRVEMNTFWIGAAVVVPIVVALLVAAPLWIIRVGDDLGSVAGAGVVLLFTVAFIAREYGEVEAVTRRCLEASVGCRFAPQPFTRYAIFGAVGMCQVFLLFVTGLTVEERLRRRDEARLASR